MEYGVCGLDRDHPVQYNLDDRIAPSRVLHSQPRSTPRHEVSAFGLRDEVIETNGENHTFHAGA